jgi:hypothetical protein
MQQLQEEENEKHEALGEASDDPGYYLFFRFFGPI